MKKLKLTTWIFIALILGFVLGAFFPEAAHFVKPFRTVFLNGVKCIIAPLIFASIVLGINSAGSVSKLGKTGFRALIYFEIATTLALVIGLIFVNWLRPGDGLNLGSTIADTVGKATKYFGRGC